MKKNTIIGIVMIAAAILVWFIAIGNMTSNSSDYDTIIKAAQNYEKKDLCQKAISQYKNALTHEDKLSVRLKIIELYRKGIEIGEITYNGDLVSMIDETMAKYHEEKEPYEVACSYFYEIHDYMELADAINAAEKNKIESEYIDQLYESFKYDFEREYSMIAEPTDYAYGYYIIHTSDSDYSLTSEMKKKQRNYDFLSPYSSTGYVVGKREGRVFVMGSDGVWSVYLDETVTSSSGVENGRISCKIGDKYVYYDTSGNIISEEYLYAGRFCDGIAAVQTDVGKWRLINTDFEYLTDDEYEDIKLNSIEQCVADNTIFVKTDGKYTMLNVNNTGSAEMTITASTFVCSDCDMPVDPDVSANSGVTWFAFTEDDKWGFADREGNVVIEPTYDGAKSFSNGFAAVFDGEYWSFINTAAEVVIKDEFTDVKYMNPSGKCMVQYKYGLWTYISLYFW